MVYLDYSANTPVDEAVLERFCAVERSCPGNANSRHQAGAAAKTAIDEATQSIARSLNVQPAEIIYTSGASEANNFALKSIARLERHHGKHIISTPLEHSSVSGTLTALQEQGYEIDLVDIKQDGTVDLAHLRELLRPDTILVSMMLVNNELGCVLPVKEAAALVKAYDKQILFHTDAVQGFLKVPFTPAGLGVDLLSLSGHKIHAPKGIGALYIRQGLPLKPFILGGGQENGLRSGTEPTGQIAAFAVACQTGKEKMAQSLAHMNQLKAYTLERLHAEVPQVEEIISGDAPHILALTLPGYKSEVLVRVMGDKGVCISAGSACHRGKASHVYEVMGLTKPQRDGAFRVSFSDWSTKEDVDCFVQALKETQEMLFPTMS